MQHDYVVSNDTGAAVRADINNALAAIVTNNSGATAPSSTFAYQFWADTTTGLLKIRNAANSAWITVGTLASAFLGNMQTTGGAFSGATTYSNTDYTGIPVGTTAQRPVSPSSGYVRYNSDLKSMEIYEESVWINLGDRQPLATKTGAYTLVNSDDTILADATSAGFTLTLPTAVGITGKCFTIKKIDSSTNIVTVDGNGSETIDGSTTNLLNRINESLKIISDGTNWKILNKSIPVTATNDSPPTGYVGEYVSSLNVGPVSTTATGVWKDITSITLSAGDWDISAGVVVAESGASITRLYCGVNNASGDTSGDMVLTENYFEMPHPTSTRDVGFSIPSFRRSISSSTTFYVKVRGTYVTSDIDASGSIWARRVR